MLDRQPVYHIVKIGRMVASAVPGQPQYAPRLLAVHPLCPMALQHRDAWKLQHYRTIESWASIAGAEYRNAVCNVCDSAVQLLIFNIVSQLHCAFVKKLLLTIPA